MGMLTITLKTDEHVTTESAEMPDAPTATLAVISLVADLLFVNHPGIDAQYIQTLREEWTKSMRADAANVRAVVTRDLGAFKIEDTFTYTA